MLLLTMLYYVFVCYLHVTFNYAYWYFYYVNICIMVLHLYLIAILLTYFVYLNQQKITKRKVEANPICCLVTYFGTNKSIFVFMCLSMHTLHFTF